MIEPAQPVGLAPDTLLDESADGSPDLEALGFRPPRSVEDGTWRQLPPPPRRAHTATYDPVRDRLLMVGGSDARSGVGGHGGADVWSFELREPARWVELSTTGSPPPGRIHHSTVYDPSRDRLLVFGGLSRASSGTFYADVWELSLGGDPRWSPISPAGTPPDARYAASAIYDPIGDRMIVFGGRGSLGWTFSDVWALDLAGDPEWTRLEPPGDRPTERVFADVVYDPTRDLMLVFGGYNCGFHCNRYFRDLWALSLRGTPRWSRFSLAGISPGGRWEHETILDPTRDRLIVFVGWSTGVPESRTWALPLSQHRPEWIPLALSESPPQRHGLAAVHDPVRDRLIMFGGYSGGLVSDPPLPEYAYADLWALTLSEQGSWMEISPSGIPPAPRDHHTVTYDGLNRRLVIYTGDSDTWSLWLGDPPRWERLRTNEAPPERRGHSAVWDSDRNRLLVFGGQGPPADVWALSLVGEPLWTRLTPEGSPPSARWWHSALYDHRRKRMIIFGGRDGGPAVLDDVWALELATTPRWQRLDPARGGQRQRWAHVAVYDARRERMVVFGGARTVDLRAALSNDVTILALEEDPVWRTWRPPPDHDLPRPRFSHRATFDSRRQRLIVCCGTTYITSTFVPASDLWAFDVWRNRGWARLTPDGRGPSLRGSLPMAYDEARDQVVLAGGGNHFSVYFLDLPQRDHFPADDLESGMPAPRPEIASSSDPAPTVRVDSNPSYGTIRIAVEAPDAAGGTIELVDIGGRRLASRRLASIEGGALTLDVPAGPGLYFIQLRVRGVTVAREKVVVLDAR